MAESTAGRRASVVWGVSLVLVGVLLLAAQLLGADVLRVGWPIVVIVPGLLFLIGAFTAAPGRGVGYLAIPGCIVLAAGIVLAVQNLTGDWDSWAYAWALVAPTGVGVGLLLAGARERARGVRVAGATVTAIGLVLFVFAEWLTVRAFSIGGRGLGPAFGALLPAAFVALGLYVVVAGVRRGR